MLSWSAIGIVRIAFVIRNFQLHRCAAAALGWCVCDVFRRRFGFGHDCVEENSRAEPSYGLELVGRLSTSWIQERIDMKFGSKIGSQSGPG